MNHDPQETTQEEWQAAMDAKLRDEISEAIFRHVKDYTCAEDWWQSPFTKPGDREPIEHLLDRLEALLNPESKRVAQLSLAELDKLRWESQVLRKWMPRASEIQADTYLRIYPTRESEAS